MQRAGALSSVRLATTFVEFTSDYISVSCSLRCCGSFAFATHCAGNACETRPEQDHRSRLRHLAVLRQGAPFESFWTPMDVAQRGFQSESEIRIRFQRGLQAGRRFCIKSERVI